MKRILWGILISTTLSLLQAQPITHPLKGVNQTTETRIALTQITLIPEPGKKIPNATLLIQNGKILNAGTNLPIPKDFVVHPMPNAWVYPGLIELWAPQPAPASPENLGCWNPAVHPQTTLPWDPSDKTMSETAKKYRNEGFTTLLVAPNDGIFRGKASLVHTGSQHAVLEMLKPNSASILTFEKGKSPEEYPSSLMGALALIRQTFSDADWYGKHPNPPEYNPCLKTLHEDRSAKIPFLFQASNINDVARIKILGDELNLPFIIRGSGREYERTSSGEIQNTKLILPLHFPLPPETGSLEKEKSASLFVLRHWAWAPSNPYEVEKAGLSFAFTTDGLKNISQFRSMIRQALDRGLSEEKALAALTTQPAAWLGMEGKIGTLNPGAFADLAIFNGDLFDPESHLLETWIQGKAYPVSDPGLVQAKEGVYTFRSANLTTDSFLIKKQGKSLKGEFKLSGPKNLPVKIEYQAGLWELSFTPDSASGMCLLSGTFSGDTLRGFQGNQPWTAIRSGNLETPSKEVKKDTISLPPLPYPNRAWGTYETPQEKTYLIRNVQIWTNVEDSVFSARLGLNPDLTGGILTGGDVLISNGKIQKAGKNLSAPGAIEVDGSGMHLTPGIIDEHSHIAIERGVNEGTQAITSEVRIGDAVRAEDLNIFRQLSGGVTTSQLLHGSANPIGGQSAIIKLRWGMPAASLIMKEAPGFIKFALGENVKQSNWGDSHTTRFPQSRPGVEQVIEDGFQRALAYDKLKATGGTAFRKDLELETLSEILKNKRFITCHSYVQSEITMLMRLAEKYNFRINTFTHVLEGYKIADKLKAHGASASSFSDWWAYKYEVIDAIPYNGALLTRAGVNTGFNSDDAEMGRRLNQEAAKAIKYGGLTEAEALKLVTLNPAKMLKIDQYVGSIEPGKQADVVLWSDHPLSIYAVAQKTWIDGKLFYDVADLQERHQKITQEKNWLLQRAIEAGKNGTAEQTEDIHDNRYHCDTLEQDAHEDAH